MDSSVLERLRQTNAKLSERHDEAKRKSSRNSEETGADALHVNRVTMSNATCTAASIGPMLYASMMNLTQELTLRE